MSRLMNNLGESKAICLTFFLLLIFISALADNIPSKTDKWAYERLLINKLNSKPKKVVTVAVIDDAFRFSHKSLKGFLYTNSNEVQGNFRDDDNNGYVDDIHGWDIADNDADVSITKGREDFFYHGTHIAGIITSVFKEFYGDDAENYLRIIPIKVLSDFTQSTYLESGYKGIEYACKLNPDIICCAWSGGEISNDVRKLLDEAISKGTIVIGSAGNFATEKVEMPASLPGVISVAAVDSSFQKVKASNYGMKIDFVAPGKNVYGPFSSADNSFFYSDGTSPAAAIIAGCFAALRAYKPEASSDDLIKALKNTSTPVDGRDLRYAGKLGSGFPNIEKVIRFLEDEKYKYENNETLKLSNGNVFYNNKKGSKAFKIEPDGAFKGIHFFSSSADYKGDIQLSTPDSVYYSGAIKDLHKGVFIPVNKLNVDIKPKKASNEMEFSYYVQTIDSTTLYCKDIQILNDTSGIITDNSEGENYANLSSCKWQIKVPEGKKVKIEFLEMDIQANVDFIWIFDGTTTQQDRLIAKFSGQNKPPVITSLSNQVLIWFVTDETVTGKGWKLKYEPTDKSIYFE